jgi:hypothetical protein
MVELQYDAFEHLYRSLFAKPSDLFVMLTAYFDDSGTDSGSRVAVVAGYLGSTANWKRFAEEWRGLLSEYKITIMRRADLENFRGEFRNWDGEFRTEFVRKVHAIIHRYTYSGVGSAILKDDFEKTLPVEFSRDWGNMYSCSAYFCTLAIDRWCTQHNYDGPVNFVFEAGTIGAGQISTMFRALHKDLWCREQYHVGSWSFGGKDLLPLQAADTVAYEWYKLVNNEAIQGHKRKPRRSAGDLFREDEYEYFRWADEPIFRLVREELTRILAETR